MRTLLYKTLQQVTRSSKSKGSTYIYTHTHTFFPYNVHTVVFLSLQENLSNRQKKQLRYMQSQDLNLGPQSYWNSLALGAEDTMAIHRYTKLS